MGVILDDKAVKHPEVNEFYQKLCSRPGLPGVLFLRPWLFEQRAKRD